MIAQQLTAGMQHDGKIEHIAAYIDDVERLRPGLEIRVYRAELIAAMFGDGRER